MLTIFTPSFDRAHALPRLHESLKSQTDMNFEWIIINDGSTDNTDDIVEEFIRVGAVDIVYLATRNGGKMRAINQAVKLARGDFFSLLIVMTMLRRTAWKKYLGRLSNFPTT